MSEHYFVQCQIFIPTDYHHPVQCQTPQTTSKLRTNAPVHAGNARCNAEYSCNLEYLRYNIHVNKNMLACISRRLILSRGSLLASPSHKSSFHSILHSLVSMQTPIPNLLSFYSLTATRGC
eukprot:1159924-Pelagomonas_calceolata.AAC.15